MFRQYLAKGGVELPTDTASAVVPENVTTEEDRLLAAAVVWPAAWERVHQYLPLEDITNPLYRALFNKAGELLSKTGALSTVALEECLLTMKRPLMVA